MPPLSSNVALPDMHCIRISAFWNNSGDDGLAIDFSSGDLNALAELLREQIVTLDADPTLTVELAFEQLSELATESRQTRLSQEQQLLATLNIAWLERIGALKADDHNGMLYLYAPASVPDGRHRYHAVTLH